MRTEGHEKREAGDVVQAKVIELSLATAAAGVRQKGATKDRCCPFCSIRLSRKRRKKQECTDYLPTC